MPCPTDAVPAQPRLRRLGRALLAVAPLALAAGLAVAAVGPAAAAAPVAQAGATFLSGAVLGSSLDDVVQLSGAHAVNDATPTVTEANPLDATVLNAVQLDLGGGLQLFGGTGVVQVGAAGQYAEAAPDGSSHAAAGAVSDQGGLAVGGASGRPSDARLDLGRLLDAGLAGRFSRLEVATGALAATATQAASGSQSGDYRIDGLAIDLTSPALAGIAADLAAILGPVQPLVDGLQDTLQAALGALVSVSGRPTLADALTTLGVVSAADGSVALDLHTGRLTVDVAALLTQRGLDLNDLAPGTEVLPYVTAALTSDLLPAVRSALIGTGGLLDRLTTSVTGITATVNLGLGSLPVPSGVLNPLLQQIVGQLTSPVTALADALGGTVITPVAGALAQALAVEANVQSTTGGAFTERALAVTVLPAAATPAARIELASATVGPNAGPAEEPDQPQPPEPPDPAPPAAAPTATALDPDHGPATGGTPVTVTGTGFVAGATTVTIGGVTVPAAAVTVDGPAQLGFVTPPHPPGPVDVTVGTPAGPSDPLAYTYTSGVVAPVITSPTDGSTTGEHRPAIGGTGAPGATITVVEAGTTICTAPVTGPGRWSCRPGDPLGSGGHSIVAYQQRDASTTISAPVRFTVIDITAGSDTDTDVVTVTGTEVPSGGGDPPVAGAPPARTADTGVGVLALISLSALLAVLGGAVCLAARRPPVAAAAGR